jgi:hypothetical protein
VVAMMRLSMQSSESSRTAIAHHFGRSFLTLLNSSLHLSLLAVVRKLAARVTPVFGMVPLRHTEEPCVKLVSNAASKIVPPVI